MQVRRNRGDRDFFAAAVVVFLAVVVFAMLLYRNSPPAFTDGILRTAMEDPTIRRSRSIAPLPSNREEIDVPAVDAYESEPLRAVIVAGPSEDASPLLILPIDEAAKYIATRANLIAWIESVEVLNDIDVDKIEWTEDLAYIWGICKEHQALRAFILDHQGRERQRWADREQSVSLEAELTQVRGFMDLQLGYDENVWQLVNAYSLEVSTIIRSAGETADSDDDEGSRWDLQRALSRAGAPAFEATAILLRGQH